MDCASRIKRKRKQKITRNQIYCEGIFHALGEKFIQPDPTKDSIIPMSSIAQAVQPNTLAVKNVITVFF